MGRKTTTKKKRITRRHSTPWFLKGFSTLMILVAVVIVGSILLVGGAFPKEIGQIPTDTGEVIIDNSASGAAKQQQSLQLQTLKFKSCSQTVTVDLLLDRSSSMNSKTPSGATKIQRLKEAVMALTGKLNDNSIIGIQSFASGGNAGGLTNNFRNDVPVSYFKDVKGTIANQVNALNPDGATPTHDALDYSYNILKEAVTKYPDRKFNFIFVSDGAPCPGLGCTTAGQDQDPRKYTPNPAQQIKDLGVNVYSVAIYDSGQSGDPNLATLMKDIASSPNNYYAAETADDTSKLLSAIAEKICN